MPKKKNNQPLFTTCCKCQASFFYKDVSEHEKPNRCRNFSEWDWNWETYFIYNNILHSKIEVYDSSNYYPKISEIDASDMVFLSVEVMQTCGIVLGDPVILQFKHICTVKTAWPRNDKFINIISLTESAINLEQLNGHVKLQAFKQPHLPAEEILLKYEGHYKLPELDESNMFLKLFNEHKIITMSSKITFPHYGRTYIFTIMDIKSKQTAPIKDEDVAAQIENLQINDNDLSKQVFYQVVPTTYWKIEQLNRLIKKYDLKFKLEDVGGYEDAIQDITDVINIVTSQYENYPHFLISKGILLYGCSGVGKTMIAEAIINEFKGVCVIINLSSVYSHIISEIEIILKNKFNEAKTSNLCVIYLEDLDTLFKKKNKNDHEQKIVNILIKLLEEVNDFPIAIIATTSKIDNIDSSLRRPGRFDKEFEISIPTPITRNKIIRKMIKQFKHDLNDEDINHIAFVTHGYVGADLRGLCSQAIVNSIKRSKKNVDKDIVIVQLEDFMNALNTVIPSAMKQVLVEVSNVKWEDVGGQDELKLKLKQAVEWPLKYPEIFERMGITPPRGVLMYGPPGCSKTMIAKALATESKLNFLNIKGPELFSKWVGESEKAVRDVFKKARQVAPSIIFIDEIDAISTERGNTSNNGGSNVQERVLAQLLTELDGVTALNNVTLVAATNRPDRIDKALLRPGRLDRIIYVPLPDSKTREEIFKIKMKKMPLHNNVNVEYLVESTEGYSGAEIQAVCHEAAMNALEKNLQADTITIENFAASLSIVQPRTPISLIQLYKEYKQ